MRGKQVFLAFSCPFLYSMGNLRKKGREDMGFWELVVLAIGLVHLVGLVLAWPVLAGVRR